jgi:hypothetical protein
MRSTLRTLLVALPLAAAAAPLSAQVTTFLSRSAFQAAAGPLATETFDRPFTLVPTAGATYAVAGGTVTFDANHGDMTIGGGDLFADLHPAGDPEGPRFLRFTFAAPVTAFGADFGAFDSPSIVLRAFVGGRTFDVGQGFFGVVSAVPFTTIELRDPSARTFFVVDNASASASASVVPEPATVWLMLAGVAAGAAVVRRRRPAATRTRQ